MRLHRRAVYAVLASACAVSTLLAGPLQGVARADGGPLVTLEEWAQFQADHPELTATEGASTTVYTCEVVWACPEGVVVGTFALSYSGTSALLHWAFGSSGDDRSFSGTAYPGSSVITNTQPAMATGLTSGSWAYSLGGVGNSSNPQNHYSANISCLDHTLLVNFPDNYFWDGFNNGTGHVSTSSACGAHGGIGDVWLGPAGTVTSGYQGGLTPTWALWHVDPTPNPDWDVVPHMRCRLSSGSGTVDVSGDPVTLHTGAGITKDWTLPSCPAGDTPLIGYITGGRPSDPATQVLEAVPVLSGQVPTSGTSTSTTTTGTPSSTTTAPAVPAIAQSAAGSWSGSTSVTVTLGNVPTTGNVLVAATQTTAARTVTASGWTSLGKFAGGTTAVSLYARVVASGASASYTFGLNSADTGNVEVYELSGTDGAPAAWPTASNGQSGVTTSVTTPAVTTGRLAIYAASTLGAATGATPTGYTVDYTRLTSANSGVAGHLTVAPAGTVVATTFAPSTVGPSQAAVVVPAPGTQTTTTPSTTQTTTTTTTTTGTNPTTGAPGSDSCIGGIWSWNPVDWVFTPVKCALEWAFVPSSDQVAQLQTDTSSLASTVPFSYVADAWTWIQTAFGGASSACLDLHTDVPPFGSVTFLDTCTPGAIEGVLMSHRTLLGVALYVSLLAPLLWWAWRAYAPGSTGSA